MENEQIDVAIVGGGPAGLQAALLLARAGKKTVVFDRPDPPRNAASHGVHNFIGLEGLLPAQIREKVWEEIARYELSSQRRTEVEQITRSESGGFLVQTTDGVFEARRVLAAFGFADDRPQLPGFQECWGKTIIPCPFCDGYENRGRSWGLVPEVPPQVGMFPRLGPQWARSASLIVQPHLEITNEQEEFCRNQGISVLRGAIVALEHQDGMMRSLRLEDGTSIEAETLLWQPKAKALPLLGRMKETLGLSVEDNGTVPSDENQMTNVPGLYVAGDLRGWSGAIRAAAEAGEAAIHMVKTWL